jgi:XTP/dITP diphosphohydrolase
MNRHKVRELAELLARRDIQVRSLADHRPVEPPVEDAGTFAGNARIKAVHYARNSGLPALADDSGLCVDALDGRPGVHSARYAGDSGDDEANNDLLLHELREVPEAQRGAHYVCALCVAAPDGRVLLEVEGTCHGTILDRRYGSGGFGYDPMFQPVGQDRSFGMLPPEVKARISHRAVAIARLLEQLPAALATAPG